MQGAVEEPVWPETRGAIVSDPRDAVSGDWHENGNLNYRTGGVEVMPDGSELYWDGVAVAEYGTDEWWRHVPHAQGEPPAHVREEVEGIVSEWQRNLRRR